MNIEKRLITLLSKVKAWKPTKPQDLEFKATINREIFRLIVDIMEKEANNPQKQKEQ